MNWDGLRRPLRSKKKVRGGFNLIFKKILERNFKAPMKGQVRLTTKVKEGIP